MPQNPLNIVYVAPYPNIECPAGATTNLGADPDAGDQLVGLLVVPATLSPGAITINDGSTDITVFTGGADSVATLVPFFIPWNSKAVNAGWSVTTGANVSAVAFGRFSS